MQLKVKNTNELLSHGDKPAREKVLHLLNSVLEEVDTGKRIRKLMRLDGDMLRIGKKSWDLRKKRNIYLLGAGKACNSMAQAVCDVLGERITKSIIAVKIAEAGDRYVNTDVYVGGHPLPNTEGLEAAKAMLALIDAAGPDDLFISVISGGSSSLIAYPVDGITLEDEIIAHDMLLKTGAGIGEINSVRRHISRTNGGRIAERIVAAKAELINLILSDSISVHPPEDRSVPVKAVGTPVAPDNSTIEDARNMILNYELRESLPANITNYLWDDTKVRETPKEFGGLVTSFRVGVVSDSCAAATAVAKKMGIPLMILTTYLEGESRDAGVVLASVAKEIRKWGRPINPPCFLVCSGETTVRVTAAPKGTGGPSQEFALSVAAGIRGMSSVACAAVDTDGTDGPTLVAGGIVDGKTMDRLDVCGISVAEALRYHSTGAALKSIGDLIITGNTGTNLCDFNVIYIE